MKVNQDTVLVGERVVLVPYESKHVCKYHEWMMSSELQELTASEPLSLEQEYEMQRSWRNDDDKCTFIVLDQQLCSQPALTETDCMAGDVNLFFNDEDDRSVAEVEVMIAERSCRGRGCGKESVLLMMAYAVQHLSVRKFVSKIGMANTPSINMFKKMGFEEVSRSVVFQEITFELPIAAETERDPARRSSAAVPSQSYQHWRLRYSCPGAATSSTVTSDDAPSS
ncbi:N-acetyltransferase 9-like protein [Sycon ciliatum]|uniref:N-acetyltransferase 9-like protein n=1 Tax=Sycon ciliatum TaxID=27933 RepID=UPI0031F669B2